MSRNEWEQGELKLPSADFARLRKNVETTLAARQQLIFEASQERWKGLTRAQQAHPAKYEAALNEMARKGWRQYIPRANIKPTAEEQLTEHELYELEWRMARLSNGSPARMLKTNLDWPNNRTLVFGDGLVDIEFDRSSNSVKFGIDENNHAVDTAYEQSKILKALMSDLNQVHWTRGTGGHTWGGDEYQRDADRENGGVRDYAKRGWGPLGAETVPGGTRPWQDPKGQKFYAESKVGRHGIQGRVAKGVPAGGQFSSRYRNDSSISLRY